ncbi:probable isoprenylcysteine alpha-carbonyl methylesterase ICMEL1 [Zingiber officinale]|uniref:probable isoprenylcysteine alpha-carbonyl methylesterase ICMEL1 n=1 Tax=Zingiber officinale TaxID=94328 RepID=UPI001C4D0E08|nr:probable isoprenylcysteine alpha-carbonyl methylesterase ICMEL1 [Zingiber officinale]
MPSDLELLPRLPSPSPVGEAEERTSSPSASSAAPEDARPILLRATPQAGGGGGGSSRRRRNANESSLRPLPSQTRRSQSFGREVSHAAAETYLLTRLAITLLRYLGLGYRWITKFLALVCYATLLMPGFVQVGYYYFFSSQVRRSIVYGDRPRNRLDLYLPLNVDSLRPVVVFITGGAWIIGYKAWGSLLGRRLAEKGIIVACLDYRNFPQGTISDMVEDVSEGISFVCKNAECYGCDPNRIYLMGQSAGAHIAACTILNQTIKESGEKESITWSVSQIKAYFGISGGYNMLELVDHFHRRGLYRSLFLSIMEGEQSLWQFSPEILVQDPSIKHVVALMPPIILFHGTSDKSIPSNSSEKFVHTLKDVGAKANFVMYDGKTHTDLFLQDPLRGGRDELLEDIIKAIYAGDEVECANLALTPLPRRLVPEFMLKLAHKISPF